VTAADIRPVIDNRSRSSVDETNRTRPEHCERADTEE